MQHFDTDTSAPISVSLTELYVNRDTSHSCKIYSFILNIQVH
jgi:hypothetical protein